jgi:hypothetical protein
MHQRVRRGGAEPSFVRESPASGWENPVVSIKKALFLIIKTLYIM